MKKVIAVLTIAGMLTACNNAADSTEATKDSIDSTASEVKDRLDSTGTAAGASVDSAKEKIDSSAEAKKDQADSLTH